jgi:biopolymer transport protein ExbD
MYLNAPKIWRASGRLMLLALGLVLASANTMVAAQTTDLLATTPTALIVTVDARGEIALNDKAIGTAPLTTRLRAIFTSRKKNLVFADRDGAMQTRIPLDDRIAKRVYVHPDAALPLAKALKILRDIRDAGAHPLSVSLNSGDVSYSALVEADLDEFGPVGNLLLVRQGVDREYQLNGERLATPDALREKLVAVFNQRTTDRLIDPKTGEVLRKVVLEFDRTLNLTDILNTLVAVRPAYPSPVVLSLLTPPLDFEDVLPPRRPSKPKHINRRR